jgi:hypothetical protein
MSQTEDELRKECEAWLEGQGLWSKFGTLRPGNIAALMALCKRVQAQTWREAEQYHKKRFENAVDPVLRDELLGGDTVSATRHERELADEIRNAQLFFEAKAKEREG